MLADAGPFLIRLVRLDPGAVVRLRPGPDRRVTVWAALPWGVLVGRTVPGPVPGDVTVGAAALLDVLGDESTVPPARDADWRWPLPPDAGTVVERVAADDLRKIATAAAGTLREASTQGVGGRAVGSRALRDALLDHVAIVVTPPAGRPVEVPQRLVQAIVRMGFLRNDAGTYADVRVSGRWIGLAAPYGVAWLPPVSQFAIKPTRTPPNG
jgi:hypothetical protein